jgi:hypothetical protein
VRSKPEEKHTAVEPKEKVRRTGAAPKAKRLHREHEDTRGKPEGMNVRPPGAEEKDGNAGPGDKNVVEKSEKPTRDAAEHSAEADLEFDEGMVEYVQMALGLIEGREVSLNEILELLATTMRQRSFDRESHFEYILRNLKQDPP